MNARFSWKHGPRTGPICAARVLTLVDVVHEQLVRISPRFRWRAGHQLYVSIVAAGDQDIVTGFALARGREVTRLAILDPSDRISPTKLREIARRG